MKTGRIKICPLAKTFMLHGLKARALHCPIIDAELDRRKEMRMPYKVVKKSGSRPYKIVSKVTGKVVGSSTTKAKADASVRARYAGEKK